MLLGVIPQEYVTDELQKIAVDQNPEAIKFVSDPSLEMQLAVVKINPLALQWIQSQSIEACRTAVRIHPSAVKYVTCEVWDDLAYLRKYDK